ncbi:YybS family protein [Neobacillus sp. FSL H8-0543]|uniref:YybS family protein n=1 Tax=Neobacillus sp. FSL H8-0543 TaxID=2954672 RepID=UPI00315885AC
MINVKRLTEGAVLLAVFAVLLLITLYVPLLGMIITFFIGVPFILFAAKNDGKITLVFVIASLFLSLIVGSIMSVPLALAYGTTGAVMGYFIRLNKSRFTILLSGTFVFLLNLIIIYTASIVLFKIDMIGEMIDMMQESMNTSAELLKNFGSAEETERAMNQFKEGLKLVKTLIPTLFVIASFFIVFIIQLVSFPMLKRFGIQAEKWKSFKDIRLPKSLLWYFLGILLVSMFANPEEGTYLFAAIVNLTYILQFLMVLQGLTFLFYYFDKKGISKAIAITIVIVSFIIPIFLYIIGILGIIDLGFDLRKGYDRKK